MNRYNTIIYVITLTLIISCAGCFKNPSSEESISLNKVEFDLAQLDVNGLRGPADGKVSVSYEFCIPDKEKCKSEVKRIDRSVEFKSGSRGRIGAKEDECLCVGTTGKDYREVLSSLAELPYIERIIECHFE